VRLIHEADVTLVPGATPEVLASVLPAIENRLVLALVISPAEVKVFFAQMIKVDHLPPASVKAFCKVWSSDWPDRHFLNQAN